METDKNHILQTKYYVNKVKTISLHLGNISQFTV